MDDRMRVDRSLVVRRGDEVVAVVDTREQEAEIVAASLRNAGYDVSPAERSGDGAVDLVQECQEDEPRPCELTIVLGRLQELAREQGVSSEEIDELERQGSATEQEAYSAAMACLSRLSGDVRQEADLWFAMAWPEGAPHG